MKRKRRGGKKAVNDREIVKHHWILTKEVRRRGSRLFGVYNDYQVEV